MLQFLPILAKPPRVVISLIQVIELLCVFHRAIFKEKNLPGGGGADDVFRIPTESSIKKIEESHET